MKALNALPQSVDIAGGRPSSSHSITSLVPRQTVSFTRTPTIHTLLSPCDGPRRRRLRNVSVRMGSQLGKPRLRRAPFPPPDHYRSPTSPASSRTPASQHSHLIPDSLTTVLIKTKASIDLDDEEWVDPTSIPPTPLEPTPLTAFPPPNHRENQIIQQRE